MFLAKQKKQILLTGAFFLALVFSFFLNNNLELSPAFAQSAPLGTPDVSNAPSLLNNAKSLASGSAGGDQCWLSMGCFFTKLIYAILSVCAFFAGVAASMFTYVIDVSHFQAIMSNPVVWEMWKIVRDFMNLFFIFVLLMSAFYTIFQVDKYSYKNVLPKVILGALFVNFSFPIARAIIDVGNVMMYSFINDIFGMTGKTLTSGILSGSGLMAIFLPESKGEFDSSLELKFYFIAIICMFMFMISFLTLALMMLYRLVMLPILVMFSPIGFVAGAIPGMDGYAKQWWDKLIKSVFFGPIAVFMVMVSVKFLAVWGSANSVMNFSKEAIAAENGTLLSGVVYMTIPIIFFWIAITSAEKMSSEASGMANSFGSKFLKKAKDWGLNRTKDVTGYSAGKRMVDAYSAERAKRGAAKLKDSKFTKWGEGAGKGVNNALDKGRSKITIPGMRGGAKAAEKRYNKRQQEANEKDIAEKMKELQDSGLDRPELIATELMNNPVTRDDYMKQAAQAKAYNELRPEYQQNFIETRHTEVDNLLNKPAGSVLPAHLRNNPQAVAQYTADQQRAQAAYTRVKSGNYSKQDMSTVSAFITHQMKQYVNAGSSHGKTTSSTTPPVSGMNNQTPPPPQTPPPSQTPPSSTWTTSPGAAPSPPPQAPPSPPPLSNP